MAEEKLTLAEKIYDVLKDANKLLTSKEVAIAISQKYPEYYEKKQGDVNQIQAEVSSEPYRYEKYNVLYTADRPRKFYLKEWDNLERSQETDQSKSSKKEAHQKLKEADIYPILIDYLKTERDWGVYAMRINEKTSSNSKGSGANTWLHPDIAGIKDVLNINKNEHIAFSDFINITGVEKFSLYSFEVKDEINISNARESFFQTLANSSWANYAYLVCRTIKDDDTREELKMLCQRFGIGLLRISIDEANKTYITDDCEEIVVGANKSTDPFLINRISKENTDFKEFLEKVNTCYRLSLIKPNDWK